MFERFTDQARRVLVLAQEEARLLSHNFIGTEHILLGLIHENDGIGAQTLRSMGVSLATAREKVAEMVGPAASFDGSPPFTPRGKKVLELSLREAVRLEDHHIGTEHMLLGLVREGEGVAAQVLVSLGVDLSDVRRNVVERMSVERPQRDQGPSIRLTKTEPLSPRCVRCSADLEEYAVFRVMTVRPSSDSEPGLQPREVVFVCCERCGSTVGVR